MLPCIGTTTLVSCYINLARANYKQSGLLSFYITTNIKEISQSHDLVPLLYMLPSSQPASFTLLSYLFASLSLSLYNCCAVVHPLGAEAASMIWQMLASWPCIAIMAKTANDQIMLCSFICSWMHSRNFVGSQGRVIHKISRNRWFFRASLYSFLVSWCQRSINLSEHHTDNSRTRGEINSY